MGNQSGRYSGARRPNVERASTLSRSKSMRSTSKNQAFPKWDSKEAMMKLFKIQLEVYREGIPTVIDERTDKVLKFRTPTMKARAKVTIPPIPFGQMWTIGWVQACTSMNFVNIYGELGFSSWEFPQLNIGLGGVNDSDGMSYPFYGHETEMFRVTGPLNKEVTFTVSMTDSPASQVTLQVPSRCGVKGSQSGLDLTKVRRKQKFNSWLVAFNEVTYECYELKCLHWEVDVHIEVLPQSPQGRRAKLMPPREQALPCVLVSPPKVPQVARMGPAANFAQMLVWRPHLDSANAQSIRIIVPPQVEGGPPSGRELKNPTVYKFARECF